MAAGVVKKGKIEHTPCRVAKGYEIGKGGPGTFAPSEMCNGRASSKKKSRKSGGKRKSSKGRTATGKKVGVFKGKGGRCFRRLKSGKTKPVKKHLCK